MPSAEDARTSKNSGPDQETNYCIALSGIVRILGDGGSVAEYNELLARVLVESPPEHVQTWTLMLALSEEPFSYETFNPAADSLDRISDDLNALCPELEWMVMDDRGRMRLCVLPSNYTADEGAVE